MMFCLQRVCVKDGNGALFWAVLKGSPKKAGMDSLTRPSGECPKKNQIGSEREVNGLIQKK